MGVLDLVFSLSLLPCILAASAPSDFETDTLATSGGELKTTFIGHGTLMFRFDGKVIHVDPVGRYADYSRLPKADLILVTHEHGDHLDKEAIGKITGENFTRDADGIAAARQWWLGAGRAMHDHLMY